MKKLFSIGLLLFAALQIAKAQATDVKGTVKDDQGSPLHFVFIQDSQSKKVMFTDSAGNFTMSVKAGTQLYFALSGHSDATVNIDKTSANLQVVLKASGQGSSVTSVAAHVITTEPVGTSPKNETDMSTLANGSTISAMKHQKDATHGNRYLFDDFVHGYVINSQNTLVYNENYRYDYDKIGGVLLLTEDNNNVTQVPDNQIYSFTLYSNHDELVTFTQMPAIDKKHYVQVIAQGPKYNIYKSIVSRLVHASYTNNGFATHGNNYDEFVDDIDYYTVDPKTNVPQKISLKKKTLKTIFAAEADKLNKYLADHPGDIDDAYVSKLGDYMNQ